MTKCNSKSIWSHERQWRSKQDNISASEDSTPDSSTPEDVRSVFQQDYDRLLFSTPVRRLADKTQVWPMDENDSVRTRLTHSHEVANLARSIGVRVYQAKKEQFDESGIGKNALLNVIQPILQAAGLGHDLGNPPFGHQGEMAIRRWFGYRKDWIFSKVKQDGDDLDDSLCVPENLRPEFTEFDGNPQTLRLLTRLQTHVDNVGLDLSAGTLAAILKYPVSFANIDKENAIKKKGGYFSSEKDVVNWIREKTGLDEGQRHPLTWIMEACDDIAYSVLDVEDALKKNVISPDDVLSILQRKFNGPSNIKETVKKLHSRFVNVSNKSKLFDTPQQRDLKIQYLRAFLIEDLIKHASYEFINNSSKIFDFSHTKPLMDNSELCDVLKEIAKTYAFNNPLVLKAEAIGAMALDGLMSAFWTAISERKQLNDIKSQKMSARSSYIFSLISPNYLHQANNPHNTLRYRELRLLTDMISGMTDTYAIRLWNEIKLLSTCQ